MKLGISVVILIRLLQPHHEKRQYGKPVSKQENFMQTAHILKRF